MNLPTSIDNKKVAVELFKIGAFGNTVRQWNSLAEVLDSDYRGLIAIRQKGKSGGGYCRYNVPYGQWTETFTDALQFAPWEELYINEMMDDSKVILQGEYVVTPSGDRALHYSCERLPMRDALRKASFHMVGISCLHVIRQNMNDNSWEDFQDCLTQWPNHAIEFTVWSVNVGQSPRRNSIIWEVRNY